MEKGNYRYPEGFDPESNEWKPGYEEAKGKWEADYAESHKRWELHKTQVKAIREQLASLPEATPAEEPSATSGEAQDAATLSDDESLGALREQLSEHK